MKYMDMLARFGVGSAHPGGFAATLDQLAHFPIPAGSRVLEVGCGTGRTSCHLAKQGAEVTAVDIHPDMIKKAKNRADKEGLSVRFIQSDVRELPFPDHEFDIVMAESVTNFTDGEEALREYCRVMKPGGTLYDREMIAVRQLHPEVGREFGEFFGIPKLRSAEEWVALLEKCGFEQARIWNSSALPENLWELQFKYPDELQETDADIFADPQVWSVALKHDEFFDTYKEFFGFGVIIGVKPHARSE